MLSDDAVREGRGGAPSQPVVRTSVRKSARKHWPESSGDDIAQTLRLRLMMGRAVGAKRGRAMGIVGDVTQAVNALLDRLPSLAEPLVRRRVQKEQSATLLTVMREPHPEWRSLAALMNEIGYHPSRRRERDRTEYFLRHLPPPDGPARPDRSTGAALKPSQEQLWGLVRRVGE